MKTSIFLFVIVLLIAGCTQGTPEDTNTPTIDVESETVEGTEEIDGTESGTDENDTPEPDDTEEPDDASLPDKITITVNVSDEEGNGIAGASVSVVAATDGISFNSSGTSNEVGNIPFSDVFIGAYTITVTKEGYVRKESLSEVSEENNTVTVTLAEETPPASSVQGITWKKTEADGTFSIESGNLKIERNTSRMYMTMDPEFQNEIANTAYEWRVKILNGTSTGFPMTVDLYQATPKRLVKVEHGIDSTKVVGNDFSKVSVDLKADYHTFKLVIDANEKITLFLDGEEATTLNKPTSEFVSAQKKRLRFANYESAALLDYFYIDSDNDGDWDYKEEWDSLDNVS
jgi:hypothetical protein